MNIQYSRLYFCVFIIISIGTAVYLRSTIRRADVTPQIPAPIHKPIALTFDDGPYGAATDQILDILQQKKVKATFFVMGKRVEEYPEIVTREFAAGHLVENHSYDHAHMGTYPRALIRTDIQNAERVITERIGVAPALFRAPYGETSVALFIELAKEKITYVGWNEDPSDWDYRDEPSEKIVQNVLQHARPGGVIVLHDGRDTKRHYPRGNTIAALPQIIDHLRDRGYTFVTVDVLLHVAPYKK